MANRIDARKLLKSLSGKTIKTYKGQKNIVGDIEGDSIIVKTTRSPTGTPVPIEWVQSALDRISNDDEVEISVPSLGYRSAFCGAVLLSLPGVTVESGPPRALVGDRNALKRLAQRM